MKDYETISNLEQLKVIADEKRLQILSDLSLKPHTVKQLADKYGEAPAKVHYHVKMLEKVGLVNLVESREVSGIVEKYYQSVARHINIKRDLIQMPEADDELLKVDMNALNLMCRDAERAFRRVHARRRKLASTDKDGGHAGLDVVASLGSDLYYLTKEEADKLIEQITSLLASYSNLPAEGRRTYTFSYMLHPAEGELNGRERLTSRINGRDSQSV